MKFCELKELIRALVKEAIDPDSPGQVMRRQDSELRNKQTIPAKHDEKEKAMSSETPQWGVDQNKELRQQSPAQVKAKQVANILRKKGVDNTAQGAKAINTQLAPFLDEFDPQELFVLGPEDLADEFEKKFLH